MKKIFAILTIAMFGVTIKAQQMQEYVHLKDGSVIKGVIVEQIPDSLVKIKTANGSI